MQERQERQRSICLTVSAVGVSSRGQHVLDQIDAAARTVEFVAEQQIGRAGRGAEPAMGAVAQDLFGLRGIGIGELFGGEIGAHATQLRSTMRPGFRMWRGSKLSLTRAASAASAGGCGSNTGTARRNAAEPLIKRRMAVPCPSAPRIAPRITRRAAVLGAGDGSPDEPAAPIEIPRRIEAAGDRLGQVRRRGRRHRNPPHRAVGEPGERLDIADRAPERDRGVVVEHRRIAFARPVQPAAARAGRRPTAAALRGARRLVPRGDRRRWQRRGRAGRQIGGGGHLVRRGQRAAHRRAPPRRDRARTAPPSRHARAAAAP